MLRKCLVLALVAVGFAAAGSSKTADMDLLVKQKKVFDLLMYVDKNVLTDAEYFEIGRNYDIMSNIDRYNDKEVVVDFLMRFKMGMLNKDGLFTYYNQEMREEMMLLYRLFYVAKDFNTFYKTACWARLYLNGGLFTTAFTTAVIYRDDTKYIRLPAIYEIYPNVFFDSKTIHDAQRIVMTRGMTQLGRVMPKSDMSENVETYYLYSNFTEMCMNPMYMNEKKLSYFMEDVGLNAYYYYYRMMFPFWVDTKNYDVPSSFRGDLYYFIHQQLIARYSLERISNGLGEIEDLSWEKMNLPGFYSNHVYPNGIAMPRRDRWFMVPFYKMKYLEYLKKLEIRLIEAIDSGFVMDKMGKQVSLMTAEGLNILGNLIEGNYDSINLQYYGSYDALARDILGMDYQTKNKNYYIPSSLQLWGSSMKDPAFYRLYNKIVQCLLRFKSLLPRYTKNELDFTGVRIESVNVDKLVTFWDTKDFLINNVVDVPTMKDGLSFNIKAWQYNLNYKPFTYKINVNSDKSTKAVMRIFLGPAIEGEKYDDYSYLLNYYKYFFMMDEFEINLREGMNNIERLSTDSVLFKKEYLTGDKFYKKIVQAIQGKDPITFSDRMWGFPEHLLLPKGSVDGMRFKLFVYIGDASEGKMLELPIFGKRMWYGKPLGFPLDRPMFPWFFKLDNLYFKDVFIYNIPEGDMMSGRSMNMNMNMDYASMTGIKDRDFMRKWKDIKDIDTMGGEMDNMKMKGGERMGMMRDFNMMHI